MLKKSLLVMGFAGLITGCSIPLEPVQDDEIQRVLDEDRARLQAAQAEVAGEIALPEVMARAVLYNIEHRVQRVEQMVAEGQFELAKYELLPTLAASGGFISRNNENASRSISIFSRNETLEPSTSQDKDREVADLRFSWNLLDFGVSYFQAKQESSRFLISEGNRRKVLMRLLQQARTAYWQALGAQRLREPLAETMAEAQQTLGEIEQGLQQNIYPQPIQALRLKRQLLAAIRDMENIASRLLQSEIALANLINVPTDTLPRLVDVEALPKLPGLDVASDILERTALSNSLDVVEQIYNVRIEQAETRKALLRLLPGLEFGFITNYDSNSFLFNQSWNEASVRVTWNLLRLASTKRVLKNTDLREELAIQRRMAVNMAVVTQLNLALHRYNNSSKQLTSAKALQDVDQRISIHTENALASSAASKVEQVQAKASALRTQLGYQQAYADSQDAFGAVLASLGLNPVPLGYTQLSLDELVQAIQGSINLWDNGEIPYYTMAKMAPIDNNGAEDQQTP